MRTLVLMLGAACLLTGCGKKPKDEVKAPPASGGGDDGFMVVDGGRVASGGGQPNPQPQQPVDNRNTNFKPGAPVLGNVYRAGKRLGLLAEMGDIGKQISITVQIDDRMPTAAEITADIRTSSAKLGAILGDGTVILTNTTDKGGLWAYEVDSDKAGGIALVGGIASRRTAEEITALLGKK